MYICDLLRYFAIIFWFDVAGWDVEFCDKNDDEYQSEYQFFVKMFICIGIWIIFLKAHSKCALTVRKVVVKTRTSTALLSCDNPFHCQLCSVERESQYEQLWVRFLVTKRSVSACLNPYIPYFRKLWNYKSKNKLHIVWVIWFDS